MCNAYLTVFGQGDDNKLDITKPDVCFNDNFDTHINKFKSFCNLCW